MKRQIFFTFLFGLFTFLQIKIMEVGQYSTIQVETATKVSVVEKSVLPNYFLGLCFLITLIYTVSALKKVKIRFWIMLFHFVFTTIPISMIYPKAGFALLGIAGFSRRYYSYSIEVPMERVSLMSKEILIPLLVIIFGQFIFFVNLMQKLKKHD
jgi:hypothetical protein